MTAATAPPESPPTRAQEAKDRRALAVRIMRTYLAPRPKQLVLALSCAVVVALMSAFLMWMLNPVVKRIFIQKRLDSLILIPLLILAAGLIRGGAQVFQAKLVNRLGNRIVGDIQRQLFGRLVRADLARLNASHSGSFVSSVLYDAGLIR